VTLFWPRVTGTVVLLAALLTTGCGSGVGSSPSSSPQESSSGSAVTSGSAGSKVEQAADSTTRSVTDQFETKEIPAQPQRIVAVGSTDADVLVALGITPVGALKAGIGDGPYWEWLNNRPEIGDTTPIEQSAEGIINLEQVAALRPDLILMVNTYIDVSSQYQKLNEIAPTVAGKTSNISNETWQAQALHIGDVLGRSADAQQVVDDVETMVEQAAVANPAFKDKALSFGGVFSADAATMVFGPEDYARVFLAELGFTIPPRQLAELPTLVPVEGATGEAGTQAPVSLERLDLLDGDALVLAYISPQMQQEFESREVFRQVPVVAEGRYVPIDFNVVAAIRIPSVLAVPYVLDQLVPELAKVIN
jgi:iron complex transport system substrate-binding protein